MNKPKAIGTKAETAVTRYLVANGFPQRVLAKGRWTETGCLEFTGAKANKGYGLAWVTLHGDIPSNLVVCHRCDNPPCFNPDHLFLGTPADNTADMVGKGRHRYVPHRGTTNGRTRLTEDQVRQIRALAAEGQSCRAIGREFGVAPGTVSSVVRRVNWGWVK